MFTMPGGWELILIVFVILLLFGAAKLPDLARGTGRALRIFKAETKGLKDDEPEDATQGSTEDPTERRGITAGEERPASQPVDDPAKHGRDS
jgi:sec-independent protein translocase protein TatA